jgi:hypothetical protein
MCRPTKRFLRRSSFNDNFVFIENSNIYFVGSVLLRLLVHHHNAVTVLGEDHKYANTTYLFVYGSYFSFTCVIYTKCIKLAN